MNVGWVKRRTIIFVVACLISAFGTAKGEPLTIMAVEEPPGSYLAEKYQTVEGFSVDLVREIQRRTQNKDPVTVVPEVRALTMAGKFPNVVLIGFSRTPVRENDYHWIMHTIRKTWVMYANKGWNKKINDLTDARTLLRIGVVRGDVRADFLEGLGFSNLEKVTTHEQNLKKLLEGRVQVIVYDEPGLSLSCRKMRFPVSWFEKVLTVGKSDVYILMSKNGTPEETVKAWQDAAAQIKKDGTFDRVAEKWIKKIQERTGNVCVVENGALTF